MTKGLVVSDKVQATAGKSPLKKAPEDEKKNVFRICFSPMKRQQKRIKKKYN